ncbi:helix-turn-helix transcriptional regulator [Companilactobacillus furfuricola]|uniref:helix-turn-helix transcriptional regulator n=1 Tax=Companilactobacillus furfuricola TaxID=1462575 RepID=UPI000F78BCAC|nr:WYL domain-containing protein [Companilactobacillus furfuricola]
MPIKDIFAILFILVNEKEVTNHYLCDFFSETPDRIETSIEQLQEAGFKISIDFQSDPTYQLQMPLVMYKRFLTLNQLLSLHTFLTDKNTPKTRKAVEDLIDMIDYAANRIPDGAISNIMYFDVVTMLTDVYIPMRDRKVINLDYTDVKYDQTNRDVEPMEILYQDGAWYLWAYYRLREDFRVFKFQPTMFISPTKEKFIRRPFSIFEGVDDPRSFRDYYFVTMEFDLSLKKRIKQIFHRDKLLITKDKVVVLEKDLYSFEYAKAWLTQFGDKVTVTDPPQLQMALKGR